MRGFNMQKLLWIGIVIVLFPRLALAGPEAFEEGLLILGYGRVADVPGMVPIPEDAVFKVSFDVSAAAERGQVSRSLDAAARFLNMHHAAGVPVENLKLALVVHGSAHRDLLTDAAYGGPNPNAALLAQLVKHGVQFHLCGQTAAYYGVSSEDLLPGVKMSLSAMTSHALLQQQGYTLNPF
jgi:intracellular sulfur oxidation DsrE/DsrF family protein